MASAESPGSRGSYPSHQDQRGWELSICFHGRIKHEKAGSSVGELRSIAVLEMRKDPDYYNIPGREMTFDDYCQNMTTHSWGDEFTLAALATHLRIEICVLSTAQLDPHKFLPRFEEVQDWPCINLFHYFDAHFDVMSPLPGIPDLQPAADSSRILLLSEDDGQYYPATRIDGQEMRFDEDDDRVHKDEDVKDL